MLNYQRVLWGPHSNGSHMISHVNHRVTWHLYGTCWADHFHPQSPKKMACWMDLKWFKLNLNHLFCQTYVKIGTENHISSIISYLGWMAQKPLDTQIKTILLLGNAFCSCLVHYFTYIHSSELLPPFATIPGTGPYCRTTVPWLPFPPAVPLGRPSPRPAHGGHGAHEGSGQTWPREAKGGAGAWSVGNQRSVCFYW